MTGSTRRTRGVHLATLVTAIALAAAACGSGGDPGTATEPTSTPEASTADLPTYEWGDEPSPVVLLQPDQHVALRPWTSCWSGPPGPDGTASATCADGAPGLLGEVPDVGSPESVEFWFGMPGWRFQAAFFRSEGEAAKPVGEPEVERTGKQTFRVTGIDEPGAYRVDLSGRGEQGDVNVSFAWTIPA